MIGIGSGIGISRMRDLAALIRNMLFGAGEVGVMYDPSDLPTMFQDSAGTTAAAIEQPVGLMLDKSKGLVLGPELVTNGGFDTGDTTGWAAGAGPALAAVTSNQLTLTNNTGINFESWSDWFTTVVGKTYKVTADVIGFNGGGWALFKSDTQAGTTTNRVGIDGTTGKAAGNYEFVFVATATTTYIHPCVQGTVLGNTATFDNISVRELPGNHATQATSTARPVLRAGLDYDGVDDHHDQSAGGGSTTAFFLCAGVKPEGGAGAVRVLWSDAGTNTGYIVRLNASNQLELAAGNATAYTTIATVATLSVGTAYVVTVWDDGTNLNVQVNNGAVASVARPVVAAGTATASIGSDNGAATGWFNGLIYSLIQVKNDAGTDAERASAKAYVASKAGVTL